MNNKTVKEKVEEIIKKQTLAIICKECNGGGYNYDKKENCEECEGTGLSEWRFGTAVEDIDKLYRKELFASSDKKSVNEIPPMILDDDIADWEHDNLVKNG